LIGFVLTVQAFLSGTNDSREEVVHDFPLCKCSLVQVQELPPSVKHLLLLAAVPIVYPALGALENALQFFERKKDKGGKTSTLLFKTGARLGAL
jgi:hypothetical protein